mmetsp:Transcript_55097/g.161967  ORF Transcript_55097/g.161967 Transcript_55097/m.161967 type:complete len:315 (-) Transcript_55097:38-982(-)
MRDGAGRREGRCTEPHVRDACWHGGRLRAEQGRRARGRRRTRGPGACARRRSGRIGARGGRVGLRCGGLPLVPVRLLLGEQLMRALRADDALERPLHALRAEPARDHLGGHPLRAGEVRRVAGPARGDERGEEVLVQDQALPLELSHDLLDALDVAHTRESFADRPVGHLGGRQAALLHVQHPHLRLRDVALGGAGVDHQVVRDGGRGEAHLRHLAQVALGPHDVAGLGARVHDGVVVAQAWGLPASADLVEDALDALDVTLVGAGLRESLELLLRGGLLRQSALARGGAVLASGTGHECEGGSAGSGRDGPLR